MYYPGGNCGTLIYWRRAGAHLCSPSSIGWRAIEGFNGNECGAVHAVTPHPPRIRHMTWVSDDGGGRQQVIGSSSNDAYYSADWIRSQPANRRPTSNHVRITEQGRSTCSVRYALSAHRKHRYALLYHRQSMNNCPVLTQTSAILADDMTQDSTCGYSPCEFACNSMQRRQTMV